MNRIAPHPNRPRRRGDPVAAREFAAVIERYQSQLLRYVQFLTDTETAQDVVQETFMRFHQQVRTHGRKSIHSVKGWLFRVAHHQVIDAGRRAKREEKALESVGDETENARQTDSAILEGLGKLIHGAACRQALEELAKLGEPQRQAIVLKVIHGMTFAQVAEVTGLSIGNVSYMIGQGLRELAGKLKKDGLI